MRKIYILICYAYGFSAHSRASNMDLFKPEKQEMKALRQWVVESLSIDAVECKSDNNLSQALRLWRLRKYSALDPVRWSKKSLYPLRFLFTKKIRLIWVGTGVGITVLDYGRGSLPISGCRKNADLMGLTAIQIVSLLHSRRIQITVFVGAIWSPGGARKTWSKRHPGEEEKLGRRFLYVRMPKNWCGEWSWIQ